MHAAFKLTSLRTYEGYILGLEDTILQAYEQSSRPEYSPNGVISDIGLTAPEFQINNDVSAIHLIE